MRGWKGLVAAGLGFFRVARLLPTGLAILALAGCATAQPRSTSTPDEPAYCDPETFLRYEEPAGGRSGDDLRRLRSFRLGKVVFAGLAIGQSETAAVQELAREHSSGAAEHYCTWYLNRGNAEAARTFIFRYVPHPGRADAAQDAEVYLDVLEDSFLREQVSFLSCAEKGYLAVGCDAMKHRGPTVFGMVLAFSGCAPEDAAQVANDLWGLNGVPPEARLGIIRAAFELGRSHPVERERLRSLFQP